VTGHWCGVIVRNIHAPKEDKIDDRKRGYTRNYNNPEGEFARN
jgi:hypothetical protein